MPTLDSVAHAWFLKAIDVYPESARGLMMKTEDRFRNPVAYTLRESLTVLLRELAGSMDDGNVKFALDAIVRVRAVQDCSPGKALGFVAQLREIVRDGQFEAMFPDLEARLNALSREADQQYDLCKQDIARVRSREAQRLRGLTPWMRQTL